MGRWLKKLAHMPRLEPTELTQPAAVSSVGTISKDTEKNKHDLMYFVTQCCDGLGAEPQKVIDRLLDYDDELDIINGEIPVECLRLNIKLWLQKEMPNYSAKSLAK